MSDLTYASYQDSSIPYLKTERLVITLGGIEFIAYTYKDEVYLNLSQVANVVNKAAISLFHFCARNTQETFMGSQNINVHFQAYTTDELQKRGKDPRIVHVNVAHLYWLDQLVRAKNIDAAKVISSCSREAFILKVREMAQPSLPTSSQLLVQAYKDALAHHEAIAYLLDKPGLANKMADAHNGSSLTLEAAELDFNELCEQEGYTNLTLGEKRKYSASFSNAVRNDILRPLNQKTVSYKNSNGKTVQRKVNLYPPSSGATLRNAIS